MNDHDNNDNTPITLADIEELRAALGGSSGGTQGDEEPSYSTVMCPSHPWDR